MRDLTKWTGCPVPAGLAVEGRYVAIAPYDARAHAGPLWEALGGHREINDRLRYFPNAGFNTLEDMVAWLAAGDWITMVFKRPWDDEMLGMASYMRVDAANGVAEIGAVAHGAAMARTPMATEAHYLLARHIFDELGYRRYEWKCDNDNVASKRAAERLGFTFEGVFRQHIVAKGRNRDTAWFSIVDHEWPTCRSAMERWLDPANFDSDGRQRCALKELRKDMSADEGKIA